jgi:membrane-bound ClpP family serine protease
MRLTRRQVWLVVLVETLFLGVLALWILSRLDRLTEPTSIGIALAIMAGGDLVSVLVLQRYTRTPITLAPGESSHLVGTVMSGFAGSHHGHIQVRGERWRAKTVVAGDLPPGTPVRVVSRRGLTLWIEPTEGSG